MANALLTRAQTLAQTQIRQYGARVLLTHVVAGAYDAATDTHAPDVETTISAFAVEKPYTPLMGVGVGMSFEQAAAVLTDARTFQFAARDVAIPPLPGMRITRADGTGFTVVGVKTISPDGVPITYLCACTLITPAAS